ncbi:MAG: hypothetical protein UU95_C0034G0018 [Parcubacteria group bacterium GW2011_GWC2_42_12]|uniref:Uncharacterized protein n=2 Tax=Candidatus Falkowiibacteriota TaxID=1752728 RepID=A0A1F5S9I5_9BACT|nr:MAG: hypothetical protein UU43_C0010G0010 [Candidatus Falkowbacteria bacterium GW2011_GWA2_41_14]KKS33367.1 MAG: hypothetical protein UU95_C0034G0018 [Parcubacteria group bacterium GW2011_GWC2_42_12]OGF23378.1 MAG: hypothetical protein A3D45_02690 [Candidatus Falkowbacteria bacterium RIFCSPHIGHO2_02_FULL_42_9]
MPQEILGVAVAEPAPNDLERAEEEEKRITGEVIATRNDLYHLPGKMAEVHDRIQGIIQKLEKKYPDFQEIYLFHVISGSTTDRQKCASFDFPGNDSIVKILEDLVREYQAE